jgi:hypothetical protein
MEEFPLLEMKRLRGEESLRDKARRKYPSLLLAKPAALGESTQCYP